MKINPNIVSALIGALIVIVPGAIYVGRMIERVETRLNEAETALHQVPAQVDTLLADWTAKERKQGDEQRFALTGPWGDWSEVKMCAAGEYVCGLRQRVELPIDGDDTAMNAVAFYCCPLNPTD